jgi:glutamyl/glutaminyl-tRNA synthetase
MDTAKLAEALKPLVAAKYPQAKIPAKDFEHMVQLYKGRMNTLLDFLDWTDFIFSDEVHFEEEVKAKHLSLNMHKEFDLLAERLSACSDFNVKAAEETFRGTVAQLGIEAGVLVHPVRVALTGKAVGPGLFDTMVVLGQERTIRRLRESFK